MYHPGSVLLLHHPLWWLGSALTACDCQPGSMRNVTVQAVLVVGLPAVTRSLLSTPASQRSSLHAPSTASPQTLPRSRSTSRRRRSGSAIEPDSVLRPTWGSLVSAECAARRSPTVCSKTNLLPRRTCASFCMPLGAPRCLRTSFALACGYSGAGASGPSLFRSRKLFPLMFTTTL
jgi:hypothetical protein